MRQLWQRLLLGVLTLVVTVSIGGGTAEGAVGADYAIQPVAGAGQAKNGGYFDVQVRTNQRVELTTRIINKSSQTREFRASLFTAYTGAGGQLSYDRSTIPRDTTLKVKLRSLAQGPADRRVTVPAHGTAKVTLAVKAPAKKFAGIIMGGIRVTPVGEKGQVTHDQNGTTINNRFAYGTPVILRDTADHGHATLAVTAIRPGLAAGSTAVLVNTQNTAPWLLNNFSVKAQVTRKGDQTVLHQTNRRNLSMAPNSNFNYVIDWEKQPLEAGTYHLTMVAQAQGGTLTWRFSRDFTITGAQASQLNTAAGIKPNYLWLYITLGLLALILLMIVGFILGRRTGKRSEDDHT